jgi:membrane-associated phospholipid phosphatase
MILSKRFYIITISVFVILMAVLAIGDLDFTISEAIINEDSIWARFFDIFGEIPAYGGIILAITLLYGGRNRSIKWWNTVSSIITVVFLSMSSLFMTLGVTRYIFHEKMDTITTFAYVVMIIMTIIIIVLALYLAHTKGHKFVGFKKYAWLIILLVLSEGIIVNIIKGVWARPRMRSINDVSQFKHWYEINGWTTDNELKSFPSGHTSNGFVIIAYMMFVPYLKSIKMNYFIIGAVIWGTLVALSRVVLGAHFLSDVLVGSYITIFLFLLYERIILHKNKGDK